ncbi:MAG: ABC transporter substrate-binding protein [Armatimonadota bacterium]|nr:ABC transporter substrate-binding protein [Armatimonadota bacterium]
MNHAQRRLAGHRRRRVAAAVLVATVLAAAAWDPLAAAAPADRVLRMLWWTDVGFPTPFAFSTVGPGGVVRVSLVYDTLVWKDETGLIPWLAESWQVSADGRRVTFRLRPDARWHDGRPVTANDVRFTFEYYRRHPFAWSDTSIVQTVEVEAPRTASVILKEPFAPFLADVAGIAPVVPAHVWQGVSDPRRAQTPAVAVGSGPYRLVEHRPVSGDYRFRAVPGYYRGRPRYDEIRYTVLPAERQVLAVQSGQADVAMSDTYDVVRAYEGHPYLRTWGSEPLSIARLVFNLDRAPLDARPVRQALAHAVNRAALASLVTRGPGLAGNPGVVPPGDAWYRADVRAYPYDPVRAKALLREAGAESLSLEVLATPSPLLALLQMMLKDAGIETVVRAVDAQTRAQLIAEQRFQVALTFHIGAGGDPDYLRRWFGDREANAFAGAIAFRHAEYQRLAAAQARALNPAERRRLVGAMQQILAEELPTLPLYHRRFYWLYDNRMFTPVATRGGIMNGIPSIEDKRALLRP